MYATKEYCIKIQSSSNYIAVRVVYRQVVVTPLEIRNQIDVCIL